MTTSSEPTSAATKEKPESTEKPRRGNDLRILWHMLFSRNKGNTHQERLESFYEGQAEGYDQFRRRLLHGRRELFEALEFPEGGTWLDFGAGTGENVEYIAEKLPTLDRVFLVDLCRPLLDMAGQRISARGWNNVETVHADVTTYEPDQQVDVVTFSYSLTMIPDWFQALANAYRVLKPGGLLGVVDFYVARKHPLPKTKSHSWFTRSLWPVWFATDNVFLSPDHLPMIHAWFERVELYESRGKVPYVPFLKAPHYWMIARKPLEPSQPGPPTPQ